MLRNFVTFFALGGVATASAAYLIYRYYGNRALGTNAHPQKNKNKICNMMNTILENIDEEELKMEVHLKMEEMLDIVETVDNITDSVDKITAIMQETDDMNEMLIKENGCRRTDIVGDINQTVNEVNESSESSDYKVCDMHVNENGSHPTHIVGAINRTFVKEVYEASESSDDKVWDMHVNKNGSHFTDIVDDINQTFVKVVYDSSDSSDGKMIEVKNEKPFTVKILMEDPKVGRKVDRPILHDVIHYLRKKITKKKEPKRTRLYFQRIETENGTSFLPIESFEDLRDMSNTIHNGRYVLGNYAQKTKPSKFRRFFNYLNCARNNEI